jgi:two-component system chemotaxis response regulator CheY
VIEKSQFNILVVDDSDFARKQIVKIINAAGYNVVGDIGSAKEAIGFISENKVHLSIIDVVMPESSGIELAQVFTNNFQDMGIIMMSSLGQERIILECIASGAQDFIQKPIQPELLIDSIEKARKHYRADG